MKYLVPFIIILLNFPSYSFSEDSLKVIESRKEIILTGYTRNERSMTVSSEVSGKVLKVNYDVGDSIGKKPFIVIDPTFIDLQIESSRQSIKKLEINIGKLDSRISYLKKKFMRIDALHKSEWTAEGQRDDIAQDLEQAELDQKSIKQEIEVLEVKHKELSELKKRHNIYAPTDWIVTNKVIEANEIIQPGTPLGVISNFKELIVPFSLSNDEILAIKKLTTIFKAELENTPASATIKWINPEFDEKSRKLNVELLIKDYSGERRGGLKFILPIQIKISGLSIPKDAVISRYKNPKVKLKTGKVISLLILGESGDYLIVAEDDNLKLGTALLPANPSAMK